MQIPGINVDYIWWMDAYILSRFVTVKVYFFPLAEMPLTTDPQQKYDTVNSVGVGFVVFTHDFLWEMEMS